MKLRNKKTGDIFEFSAALLVKDGKNGEQPAHLEYPSLEAAMEEWENVPEEPKEYWRITDLGEVKSIRLDQHRQNAKKCKQIGNYFDTKEEAEKAVEKLEAWKRLKDKGIKFKKETFYGGHEYSITACYDDDYTEDLDLLFGGE